jgi:hypothetical protein
MVDVNSDSNFLNPLRFQFHKMHNGKFHTRSFSLLKNQLAFGIFSGNNAQSYSIGMIIETKRRNKEESPDTVRVNSFSVFLIRYGSRIRLGYQNRRRILEKIVE